ncbi:hypothetical protein [Phormidium tenue]|uniref:Uncharacterized protein n=1 Tax=Phormidium tenue FACHB-1050 TaxID=2692857 RepID=A0ABR8CEH1_9CYAN|nr:hypothetical protein [Phormidium tenue]MBD2318703.1 hypothetical protein [Phormidium tenue FACHB-1050]
MLENLRSLIGEFEVIAVYPHQNQNCYINGKAIALSLYLLLHFILELAVDI